MKTATRLPLTALLSLSLAANLACGDDEGEAAAQGKAPYPAFSSAAKPTYVGSAPGGGPSTMLFSRVGQKTLGGATYGRFEMKETPDKKKGRWEIWANFKDGGSTVEVKGTELEIDSKSLFGLAPGYLKVVGDKTLNLKLDDAEGTVKTLDIKGTATYEKPGTTGHKVKSETLKGSYTLKKKGVTVETPMGPVSGCNKYEILATLPGMFSTLGQFEGDLWFSPKLGVVKANTRRPISGLGMGIKGSSGFADLGGGWASIYKVARVGGAAANFTLSTYDRAKTFDADKNTHAKMLLEIRWADTAMAKKETKPYPDVRFATMTGYFPSTLVRSSTSLFFPEENGKGYVHWIGFVDQAAKNQPKNGIAYQIKVGHEPKFSHLRVAARIIYKRISGAQ